MRPLSELTRPNILKLKPYSSARDEYGGKDAKIFLDANETLIMYHITDTQTLYKEN